MKKIKSIILLVVIATAASLTAIAQGCHGGGGMGKMNHSSEAKEAKTHASYGGIVKQAGKYKIEMVLNPLLKTDPLNFYLMNKKGKPVSNKDITGKVECTFQDGATETLTLEPSGEDGFAVQLINKTQPFVCLVTFQIKGKSATARFENSSSTNQNVTTEKATYTCSMHPEVKSSNAGNCPKCGMVLEKVTIK